MRKSLSRKIVIIVLALFLTLSAGYALFSETITIEGTATAKGDFNLTTTCIAGVESKLDSMFELSLGENGYANDSCIVSDNKVVMSVELQAPGAVRFFTIDIKNTSSIDAAVEVNSDGHVVYNNAVSNLKVTNTATNEVSERSYVGMEQTYDSFGRDFPYFVLGTNIIKLENGTYIIDDADYLEKIYKDNDGKNYFKLSPNESITVLFMAEWYEYSDKQGYISETTFTMPIKFKQFTSDMVIDTDFEPCMFGC